MGRAVLVFVLAGVAACAAGPPSEPRRPIVHETTYRSIAVSLPAPVHEPSFAPPDTGPSDEERYGFLDHADDARARAWAGERERFTERFLAALPRDEILRELRAIPPSTSYYDVVVRPEATFVTQTDPIRDAVIRRGKPARPITFDGLRDVINISPSASGLRFGMTCMDPGSRRLTLRVLDVERGVLDTLPDVGFVRWNRSGDAFYYQMSADNAAPAIRRHVVGLPVSTDVTVLGERGPGESLVREWTTGASMMFDVGKRAIVIVLRRPRSPAPAATFIVATIPIDGRSAKISSRTLPEDTVVARPYADELLLFTREGQKTAMVRAAAEGGPPIRLAPDVGGLGEGWVSADAVYFHPAPDELIRVANQGARKTIKLPGAISRLESAPEIPGIRVRVSSSTRGGWYEIDPAGTVKLIPLEPRQTPPLADVQEDSFPLPSAGDGAVMTIIANKETTETTPGPAIVLPTPWGVPRVTLRPFLKRGGIIVQCPFSTKSYVNGLGVCADTFRRSPWRRPYGVLIEGNDTARSLPFALADADAVVVRRAWLIGTQESRQRQSPFPDLDGEGIATFARARGPAHGPVLLFPGDDPRVSTMTAKLAAKLNDRSPDTVAALLAARAPRHDEVELAELADAEAFFLWALAGVGKDHVPSLKRR